MSWEEDLRILIEGKFKDEFVLLPFSKVDLGHNTNAFKPPKDHSPWIRIHHNIIDTSNAEIGISYQKARGILTVQCFTQYGTGEKQANEIIDAISIIFQNKNFDGIHFFTITPVVVGEQSGWFQKNAKVDFIYNVFS